MGEGTNPMRGLSGSASLSYAITEERLRMLREMYARGEIGMARLSDHIDQVLAGEQPTFNGRPFMADPALRAEPKPLARVFRERTRGRTA